MEDLVIIGAGPAGLSAALYASRAGAKVLILDGGAPGGKMNFTAKIENYPGVIMQGPQLAYQMFEQATSFGAKLEYKMVTDIKDEGEIKKVYCDDEVIETKYVFIASGTKERSMGLPDEEKLTGRGISYCAVCDGPFFKDEIIAVIGGGNSALTEALYLADIAREVHVIVRRDVFRADKILVDRVNETSNITIHFNKKPHAIKSQDDKVVGLEIIDSKTDELETINLRGIFPFIGLDPITDFVKDLKITNDKGYIEVNYNLETKVKGIYAGGDVIVKELRQVVTATRDGAIVGQKVADLIRNK